MLSEMCVTSILCLSLVLGPIACTSLLTAVAKCDRFALYMREGNVNAKELPFFGGEGPRWLDKKPTFNAFQNNPPEMSREIWNYRNGDAESLARWTPVVEDLSDKNFKVKNLSDAYNIPGIRIMFMVVRYFWPDGSIKKMFIRASYNCLEYFVCKGWDLKQVEDPGKSKRIAYAAVGLIESSFADNRSALGLITAHPKDPRNGLLVQCGKLGSVRKRAKVQNKVEFPCLELLSFTFVCSKKLIPRGVSTKDFESLQKLLDAQSRMPERPRHRVRDFDLFEHVLPGDYKIAFGIDMHSGSIQRARLRLNVETNVEGEAPSGKGLLVGAILIPSVFGLIAACFELIAFLKDKSGSFIFWSILFIGILAAIFSIVFAAIELPKFGKCKIAENVSADYPRLLQRSKGNDTRTINFLLVTEMVQKECTTQAGRSVVVASVVIGCFDAVIDIIIIIMLIPKRYHQEVPSTSVQTEDYDSEECAQTANSESQK